MMSVLGLSRMVGMTCLFASSFCFMPCSRILRGEEITPKLQIRENSIGMKFVRVEAGKFLMGSKVSDVHSNPNERPVHQVEITEPYDIACHEVTVGVYRKFVSETKYITECERGTAVGFGLDTKKNMITDDKSFNWSATGFAQSDQDPVVNVTWNDAIAFCKWLSSKEQAQYRLPTEAEWEYACVGDDDHPFANGVGDPVEVALYENVADVAFLKIVPIAGDQTLNTNDGHAYTSRVGSYKPTQRGLYDMHGNVREWCQDWALESYKKRVDITKDPSGLSHGFKKVIRGGSWLQIPSRARHTYRDYLPPEETDCDLGFRVVRRRGVPK